MSGVVQEIFELFGHPSADDLHQAFRNLRTKCPVLRAPDELPAEDAFIFDYKSVVWALKHPEVFSSSAEALSIGQEQPLIPLQVDPPLHTSYRRLLNQTFNPRRIEHLEPDIRARVNELLDGFADLGACDFHEQFATPLPSSIFLELMGLPSADLPMFLQWRDSIIRPPVDPADIEGATAIREEASKAINTYFEQAIASAATDGNDGLLGNLVHADFEGRALSHDELMGISHLMLLGGLDTVTATLDCMITYLAQDPDRRRQIVEDPGIIPKAVDELLRHQSPVQLIARVVTEPVELQGIQLQTGDRVMLVLAAANGDESEFDHPDQVDFSREPNRHVAFAGGHHLCLGNHLARLELRTALEEFHRRIPDYRIPEGTEIIFSPAIRQAQTLPLVWDHS